jgi:hypothetical protein
MADNDTQTLTAQNPVAAGTQPATLQAPVPVRKLAFLKHFWQPGPAAVDAEVQPQFANPGFLTPTSVTVSTKAAPQKGLQQILDDLLADHLKLKNKPKVEELRFALVDLSEGKVFQPDFAGHKPTTQGGLGSTAKLGVMFAAFQLLNDLNVFARKNPGLADEAALFSAIRTEWGKTQILSATPTITQLHPGNKDVPRMELQDRLVKIDPTFNKAFTFPLPLLPQIGAPKLEKMFSASRPSPSGPLEVQFLGALVNTPATQTYILDTADNLGKARELSFGERMFVMIDDSDNAASQTCVEDVGYLYIASSLWQSDFFNPQRGGGLWVASTFRDKNLRWVETPVPDKLQQQNDSFTSCTPAAIVAMLTLIEQRRLITQSHSDQMRALLNKKKTGLQRRIKGKLTPVGSFTRSFLKESLQFIDVDSPRRVPRFTIDDCCSKLGIGNRFSDAAIIKRTDRGKKLHYVAAAFDDEDVEKLHEVAVLLDMAIQQNNELSPSPTPVP